MIKISGLQPPKQISRLAQTVWKSIEADGPIVRISDSRPQISFDGSTFDDLRSGISVRTRRDLVTLRLEQGQFLSKQITIPKAAAGRLDDVVRYSLNIWTPFNSEEAYAVAKAVGASGPLNQSIELRCVQKAVVEEMLESLKVQGIDVDRLELGSRDYLTPINDKKRDRIARYHRTNALLALMLFSIAAAGLCVWSAKLSHKAEAYNAVLNAAISERKEGASLLRSIEQKRALLNEVLAASFGDRNIAGSMVDLAQILPEGATFQELDISANEAKAVITGLRENISAESLLARSNNFLLSQANVRSSETGHSFSLILKRRMP